MQEHYPEGLTDELHVPYGNGPLGSSYTWKGGRIAGNVTGSGVKPAAFTFILSDIIAFGTLPCATINGGTFALRMLGLAISCVFMATAIALSFCRSSPVGVVVRQRLIYNSSVHWGASFE